MPTRRLRWFTAFLVLFAAGAPAADALYIIPLRHRPAHEIEPLLRPLLRSDEALSASGYQLLLRARETRRSEIERIVATLDVAPRQLTVTVRQATAQEDRRKRDALGAEADVGSRGRIIVGEGGEREGRGRASARYRFERRSTTADQARTQMLRVQDGSPAFIRVGQAAPVVERIIVLTGRGAAVAAQGIALRDFSTGFDVLPRVRGDVVHLEITPRLSGPTASAHLFRFHELQTTVTARLGEWIDLGAIARQSSEVHRAILQSAARQSGEQVSITLKIE